MKLTIYHMYPDLLNLYGDRGNIITLVQRCRWRGIDAEVFEYSRDSERDFGDCDILFLGGGSDREQEILYTHLKRYRNVLKDWVEAGGTALTICGGYQLLGDYYLDANGEKIEGLSILPFYTKAEKGRLIGNVVIENTLGLTPTTVVGFENHGGRTVHEFQPFGKVRSGFGNNGRDGGEGLVYKNVIGTYFHGPLLPKNPHVADCLLRKALDGKGGAQAELAPLDDTAELAAHHAAVRRFSERHQ